MVIGTALFIVAILVISIWIIIEVKRFRHKIFAIVLILLILFTYFSFTAVIKKNNVNLRTIPGLVEGSKLYFAWIISVFSNVRSITTQAIHMDWKSTNVTVES